MGQAKEKTLMEVVDAAIAAAGDEETVNVDLDKKPAKEIASVIEELQKAGYGLSLAIIMKDEVVAVRPDPSVDEMLLVAEAHLKDGPTY